MKDLILLVSVGLAAFLGGFYLSPKKEAPLPPAPTLYEVTLECQRLGAQTIDKFRKIGNQVVVWSYADCKRELTESLRSQKLLVF